jgi:hypothetical protein
MDTRRTETAQQMELESVAQSGFRREGVDGSAFGARDNTYTKPGERRLHGISISVKQSACRRLQ